MTEALQNPLISLLLLIFGFYALTKGADFLVTGASSMARRWGISPLVVGLTVVAFGTSAPEFFVNVVSSLKGTNGITIGNIIGSNLANILLGIGIIALMRPIVIQKSTAWKETPFLILATFLLWSSASDSIVDQATYSLVSRNEAIMFLALFLLFMLYTFGISKVNHDQEEEVSIFSLRKSIMLFFGGLIGLAVGGDIVVNAAIDIAESFGISETLIGITVVAMGTSIPDIMTTIVAARRKHMGIAVGNIIGSNIFNILWVLAVSALIHPIPIEQDIQFDLLFTLGVAILLFLSFQFSKFRNMENMSLLKIFTYRHGRLEIYRWEGIVFVGLYIGYMIFLVKRG